MDANSKKVLIVDDEPDILEILKYNLMVEGYEVVTAKDGDEALEKANKENPALIVLDIMMPKKNGIEVCKILRSLPSFNDTLIMMLTALSDEETQIKGLESGADDFVNKPISPKVFISRVNALLRRSPKDDSHIISINGLIIDPEKYIVQYNKKDIVLPRKEFELLYLLASKPGKVFLRNQILENVWGLDVVVGDRTIDVHIRKIRQKLDIDCITTVTGVGYKFDF